MPASTRRQRAAEPAVNYAPRMAGLRGSLALGIAIAALLALATPANANVSCVTGTSELNIDIESPAVPSETAVVQAVSGNINVMRVVGGTTAIDCTGGDPTTGNIDSIEVDDETGGGVELQIWNPDLLAPGETDAGDVNGMFTSNPDEIEVDVNLGAGLGDRLFLLGGAADNQIRYGSAGVNWNVHDDNVFIINDVDLTIAGIEAHEVDGSGGLDVIGAQGDAATGDPFGVPLLFSDGFDVSDEADRLTGGAAGDVIFGGESGDVLIGAGGQDQLFGENGKDRLKAKDGVKDLKIACGKGRDRAKVDGKDPRPKSC